MSDVLDEMMASLQATIETKRRLDCLAANLATAGGLCAAFYEGFDAGFFSTGEGFNGEYCRASAERMKELAQDTTCGGGWEPTWKPGSGKAAPGWRAP